MENTSTRSDSTGIILNQKTGFYEDNEALRIQREKLLLDEISKMFTYPGKDAYVVSWRFE